MTFSSDVFITNCHSRFEEFFSLCIKQQPIPSPSLQQALKYTVLNGGKRIRPLLVYAVGRTLNCAWEALDLPACVIELIHSYSLAHDDLPAMDNADLRRGKPSCHRAFGEALAILAGDALQPLAFELLATGPSSLCNTQRLAMVQVLSRASGAYGMAAGQALDIEGAAELNALTQMYALKTGALINASIKLGSIAANHQDPLIEKALEKFAGPLGLAFQIQDDLLDLESVESAQTGKPKGIDSSHDKISYPALIGIEKTQVKINQLYTQALQALVPLGSSAELLVSLTNYLFQRKK